MTEPQQGLRRIAGICLLLVLLSIWHFAAQTPRVKFLLGDPASVGSTLLENTLDGSLPEHALITAAEAGLGFCIGCILGIGVGFLFWYSPFVAAVARPYVFVLGVIPIFAFAPLIIVWFGIGFKMKVALAAFAAFLVALTQAFQGAAAVPNEMLQLMQIMRASRLQVLSKVVFPSSISWVFNSLRMNVGVALLGAFIGEFISADRGIGFYMIRAGNLYNTAEVIAGGVYLVLLALVFHGLVVVLERFRPQVIALISVAGNVRRHRMRSDKHSKLKPA